MKCVLFFLMVVSSGIINVAKASSNVVPLSLGPDFKMAYSEEDILRGFKVNIAEGESPLKQHIFKGEINPIPFTTTYARSEIITSTEEVKDMLEIQGSLSVSYGPLISGEGSGRYLKNKVNSKQQATILYRTRRVAYARSIDVKTLEPTDNRLYSLSGDQIADIYGTKFIDQIIYGAQLDVIFTVTSTTDIDLTEIEAQLKGRIGVGPLSVGFEAKFSKQEGSSSSDMTMSIVAQASGVNFDTDPNPSFDQTNEIIKQFNAKYDELLESTMDLDTIDDEENVLNQLSPVAFTLASVADYVPKLDEIETAALDNKMSELRDVFYSAIFWKSQLLAAKDIQEAMYPDQRDQVEIFQPYVGEMDRVIEKLDAKVDECLLFRRQPLADIIGRTGTPLPLPEMYPKSIPESYVVKGLKGDLYIPSPVIIGDSKFEQVHYIGFALPMNRNNGRVEPWMTGMIRRDSDNGIVTRANTVAELERITSFAVNNALPKHMEWGDMVSISNYHSRNMLSANENGSLGAVGSIESSGRWFFVRTDCDGDYAYAGPCYEIRNVDLPGRQMYAEIGKNDQEGVGVGSTSASKWVLKESDDCGEDCFFLVNTASGRRLLEHSNNNDSNFVAASQDEKCSFSGESRLFRTQDNSPEMTVEQCYGLCSESLDCHYFSFGHNPDNSAHKGVCIGCTQDSSFDKYNGFNTYKLASGSSGVGAGNWADEKFNREKWIIQSIDESVIVDDNLLPESIEWGDMVEIKNFESKRRLYVSSSGEVKVNSGTGSDHRWIFARTNCEYAFKRVDEMMTWDNHNTQATAMGCSLASILSKEEHVEVEELFSEEGGDVWVGGSRTGSSASGWEWTDGSAFDYTNWFAGEPNNSGGEENGVHLRVAPDGKRLWNDISKSHESMAVYKCPLVALSSPTKNAAQISNDRPSSDSSSICYEIIHADSGRRMLDKKWNLVESQCEDGTSCFLLENKSSGLYLIDGGTNNGIVATKDSSDKSSNNNQWVLERFAIESPTQTPTNAPSEAFTTPMPVDIPITDKVSGGAMVTAVTLPIVAILGGALAFLLYRRKSNKKIPETGLIPTGVVLSKEDPLGFLESGTVKTGDSGANEEASIVIVK